MLVSGAYICLTSVLSHSAWSLWFYFRKALSHSSLPMLRRKKQQKNLVQTKEKKTHTLTNQYEYMNRQNEFSVFNLLFEVLLSAGNGFVNHFNGETI